MCYIELASDVSMITATPNLWRLQSCKKNITFLPLLAWNLLSKCCANLVKFIENILSQPDFIARHRFSEKDFVRDRILSFQVIILFLLNFLRGSYQDELDNFFKNIRGYKIARRIVTKSAFSKARQKLKYQAFIELNQQQTDYFYREFNPRTWQGLRLAVFDGSTVRLPHTKEIADHFGTWGVYRGASCPMARISQMFDPLNKISLDALIAPKGVDERELAAEHCRYLRKNTLVLLDRGYPAFWLFKLILSYEADFCARVSNTKWNIVSEFYHSGLREKIVEIPALKTALAQCRDLGLDTTPLRCRLIRVELDSGETEILITSLLDTAQYPYELFKELYHCRWPVEEDYKVIKTWLTMENFSGKSVLSIYQDFHAKIFSKNLTSILAFSISDEIEQPRQGYKHAYKINFAQALSKTKQSLVLLFLRSHRHTVRLIEDLLNIFAATLEAVRPGRKNPRNLRVSVRKFFPNYKPIC
jgi:hypothetical protein